MLTGASLDEILNTNIFTFFSLLSSSDAVKAEDSLRFMMDSENRILLKSKDTAGRYRELPDRYREIIKEKGTKTYNTSADFSKLLELKQLIGGGV